MNEAAGISDLVTVEVTRAFRIEPWMLILLLLIFILYTEWKSRKSNQEL